MDKNLSGILRLVVVLTLAIMIFQKFRDNAFQNDGIILIVSLFTINAILYMGFNTIKDFKGEHIGLKPAYVIFLIWNLISIHRGVHILFSFPFSGFLAITNNVNFIISYYFIIHDFIQHWIKKSTSLK
jgi:hypothetical protein